MEVLLSSVGNPDYCQDPNQPMFGAKSNKAVEVKDFTEASIECLAFILRNDLGSGNWDGGDIIENGKLIAYVSYNGRVWEVGESGEKYQNYEKEIVVDRDKVREEVRKRI
jgi:hypothetical protein